MLDFPSAPTVVLPEQGFDYAVDRARICELRDTGLVELSTAGCFPISLALRRALGELVATASHTFIVTDESASAWRIRRSADPRSAIWLLDSLDESRRSILQNFRAACGARLADSLLHELRNPMNALGLQSDLLIRNLSAEPADNESRAKALGRATQMRERLRDLLERQNSVVGLWLSGTDHARPELKAALDETVRLLRSYSSQREVRFQATNLSVLQDICMPPCTVAVRIALLALGLSAIECAASKSGQADDDSPTVSLKLGLSKDSSDESARESVMLDFDTPIAMTPFLVDDLKIKSIDELLATFRLLLDSRTAILNRGDANTLQLRLTCEAELANRPTS